MRNISFAITTQQIRDRTKTVTRRFSWWNLKPGAVLCGVEKGMGLKPGEKIVRLATIEIVSVSREPLNRMALEPEYGAREMFLEGFPWGLTCPIEFVHRLTPKGGSSADIVNRIEFKYLD